ncbi:hypothetical protein WISP_15063 [Willisornis vidua]|uniref:Cyclic AMP-dependent transcription factor ATF-7 n=1 Tax=Willisornis vidua TaxID=1566151 RepID=A0ABQ9DRF0_9PASS|nr:hypothetical protein WISP_15063 [Willisornis vidua]
MCERQLLWAPGRFLWEESQVAVDREGIPVALAASQQFGFSSSQFGALRFTNEDHLAVHKHKHEMTLKFGPARTDSVIIADQTPTPTRFLKNCEEVGLFNELASSFEHEFKKAAEEDEKKARGEGHGAIKLCWEPTGGLGGTGGLALP